MLNMHILREMNLAKFVPRFTEEIWKFWNYRWKKHVVLGGGRHVWCQPLLSGEKRRSFD